MTGDLKPCPFCGGEAYTRAYNDTFWARCERCGVETQDRHLTRPQAAAEWNTRTPARSDAVARLVEACRAIKEYETAGGPGYDDWDRYYDAMHEALAAVEKEIDNG